MTVEHDSTPVSLHDLLPKDWASAVEGEVSSDYWRQLSDAVHDEHSKYDVYPPIDQTFAAFELTPYDDVRVVILGQDPYPNAGQAHGLSFSVTEGLAVPGSLRNIHRVLESDLGVEPPSHGNLSGWAEQGVLLLNATLTVRAGTKRDRDVHRRWKTEGWRPFTEAVIRAVNAKTDRVVFILWGKDAQKTEKVIDLERHAVVKSSHPSGLSAWRGFLQSAPFSDTNRLLSEAGRATVDWSKVSDR